MLKQILVLNKNNNEFYKLRSKVSFMSDKIYSNTVDLMEFDHNFEKFKFDCISNNGIYTDLSKLLSIFPKFHCDTYFYFLY